MHPLSSLRRSGLIGGTHQVHPEVLDELKGIGTITHFDTDSRLGHGGSDEDQGNPEVRGCAAFWSGLASAIFTRSAELALAAKVFGSPLCGSVTVTRYRSARSSMCSTGTK